MMEMKEMDRANLKFDPETGLIPAIVQDQMSGQVLMLAYMNEESLQRSVETEECWFYSRSRQKLWHKGETSGNVQKIIEIAYDCDGDTLLVEVQSVGPACHTGKQSCFYRSLVEKKEAIQNESSKEEVQTTDSIQQKDESWDDLIQVLYGTIMDRKTNPLEGSYTCYLLEKGLDKILKKVGEEAAEVIIGAKNLSDEEVTYELADLTYHLMVLLVELGIKPQKINQELRKRLKK